MYWSFFFFLKQQYNIFDTLFSLNTELREEKQKLLGKKQLICAHVRLAETGERVKESHSIARRNIQKLWDVLRKTLNTEDHKDHYLFIATDSERIANESLKLFPKRILKVSGSLANIQRWKMKSGRPSTSEACLGLRRVILDWEILASCKQLYKIPGSSTFSTSTMVKNPFKQVYRFHSREKFFYKENYYKPSFMNTLKRYKFHPLVNCTFNESPRTIRC